MGSFEEALVILKKGEFLSNKLDKYVLQGHLLFEMGRLQACQPTMQRLCLETLDKAQRILQANCPHARELRVIHYIKAIARMRLIFPLLVDCFRNNENYSIDLYNICHWKNRCHPFWRDLRKQYVAMQSEKLCYLLNEFKTSNN